MGKDFSNVNPKALTDDTDVFSTDKITDYDEIIKKRINSLRNKGYSEDDILLLLFNDACRPKSNPGNSEDLEKSKQYIYTSDIHKK